MKEDILAIHKEFTRASKNKYFHGTGRRKRAIALVRIKEGKGKVIVNGGDSVKYFGSDYAESKILEPAKTVGFDRKFDFSILTYSGGKNAQIEAARLGVARALLKFDSKLRQTLKKAGFLTRDPREKERKKPGLKKARKAPQWSKR